MLATSYPTAIRSTGVGWAMGTGHLRQVCSPLLVGAMLNGGWEAPRILGVMALFPLLAGLFVSLRTLQLRCAGQTPCMSTRPQSFRHHNYCLPPAMRLGAMEPLLACKRHRLVWWKRERDVRPGWNCILMPEVVAHTRDGWP